MRVEVMRLELHIQPPHKRHHRYGPLSLYPPGATEALIACYLMGLKICDL